MVFIVVTVSIRLCFFLIPGIVFLNDQVELIVHYNLWPLQIVYVYVFTRVYSACLCVYVSIRIYARVYTLGGFVFTFITLLPQNNLR